MGKHSIPSLSFICLTNPEKPLHGVQIGWPCNIKNTAKHVVGLLYHHEYCKCTGTLTMIMNKAPSETETHARKGLLT